MSGPMGLLLALLLVSYLGGSKTQTGSRRMGSPSAAEYVLVGALLGPLGLGLIQRPWIEAFEPILVAGASWLAMIAGIGYGRSATRHQGRLAALGAALTGVVGVGVGGVVWFALLLWPAMAAVERWALAVGAGVVASATTHHGVRWVIDRHGGQGPVSAGLIDATRFSPLIPALALALVCATVPGHALRQFGTLVAFAATLGLGVGLGGVAAMLLGREFRKDESWGIVLGTALLNAGICVRMGSSAVAALFACGTSMTLLSPHRAEIRSLLVPTERAVLLPVALLAGASLQLDPLPTHGGILALALGARLLFELVRAAVLGRALAPSPTTQVSLGLGLMSTGGFTLAAALELDWRMSEPAGALLLLLAVAGNLLGELVGPVSLRRCLELAGELSQRVALKGRST